MEREDIIEYLRDVSVNELKEIIAEALEPDVSKTLSYTSTADISGYDIDIGLLYFACKTM